MISKEEAEKMAAELVQLTKQKKEINSEIKRLKGELLEYVDLENLNEHYWMVDNGHVEITTQTKYKLADVPADIKVSTEIAAIDVAEKAFKSKVTLSKEGKKMFREHHPSIVALMIPSIKKILKVII